MDFPSTISFTITNACNLRCNMCGQWSENGYMIDSPNKTAQMDLPNWKRLVDEIDTQNIKSVLLRGGEPFLFPSIMELLEYIIKKGIFVSIDTNGTLIDKYAEQIVKLKKIHLTFSVDGPEKIHDQIRGVKGTFAKLKKGLRLLNKWEARMNVTISKGITFTINWLNYKYLGEMSDIARELKINTIVIVPYCYITNELGKQYEAELKENLGCKAFTWKGFQHENSGIDFKEFQVQHQKYLAGLNGLYNYPYMPLSETAYKIWFEEPATLIDKHACSNIDSLIDIQPTGEANFCVDSPDYSFGNAKEMSITELWNSEKAETFRKYRRDKLLPVCYRCVAKHMSEQHGRDEVLSFT